MVSREYVGKQYLKDASSANVKKTFEVNSCKTYSFKICRKIMLLGYLSRIEVALRFSRRNIWSNTLSKCFKVAEIIIFFFGSKRRWKNTLISLVMQ